MLLATDFHLTDRPQDEYRFKVFETLKDHAPHKSVIGILGDMIDTKNRFSARFVNRVVDELIALTRCGCEVVILMGNHDAPLVGTPFWAFLNEIEGVHYVMHPTVFTFADEVLWLPWSADPAKDWDPAALDQAKCILMHQMVEGVTIRGRVMEGGSKFRLPRHAQIYSGDIHEQQKIGPVQYIGAAHPINFGDEYPTEAWFIDNTTYACTRCLPLVSLRKWMLDISSPDDIAKYDVRPGDQVKVRLSMSAEDADKWPAYADAINTWSQQIGVEALDMSEVNFALGERIETLALDLSDPAILLADFAKSEGIEENVLAVGFDFLKQVSL